MYKFTLKAVCLLEPKFGHKRVVTLEFEAEDLPAILDRMAYFLRGVGFNPRDLIQRGD